MIQASIQKKTYLAGQQHYYDFCTLTNQTQFLFHFLHLLDFLFLSSIQAGIHYTTAKVTPAEDKEWLICQADFKEN